MAPLLASQLSEFALHVLEGMSRAEQKMLSPRYFYDELGSALFEAITYLPEYGLTRADERLLKQHATEIAELVGPVDSIAELGSGSGRKTRYVLEGFGRGVMYCPIDVSGAALAVCEKVLSDIAEVRSVEADWMDGLARITARRASDRPLLLLFLGSSIGNLSREELPGFFRQIRDALRPGDFFLLGADVVKSVEAMVSAYDDPTGVTGAFNLNVLGRMNRELEANFDLRKFRHEARWNANDRRIEMHLVSCFDQSVWVGSLQKEFRFVAGETIWTESSHKFAVAELDGYAVKSGFRVEGTWVDEEWPFVEMLWRVLG